MAKKRKIIGRNRTLNREVFFHKRNQVNLTVADMQIREAFPNVEERLAYIKALIHGLDTEPIQENQ